MAKIQRSVGKCPFCGNKLYKSNLKDHSGYCPECLQDFFSFEFKENKKDSRLTPMLEAFNNSPIGSFKPIIIDIAKIKLAWHKNQIELTKHEIKQLKEFQIMLNNDFPIYNYLLKWGNRPPEEIL